MRAVDAFLGGDESAAHDLLPHVYNELRNVARGVLGKSLDGTVSPTVLVHEAFLKLSGRSDLDFSSPGSFYSFTAKVMRSVLVDHARVARRRKTKGTVSGLADIHLGQMLAEDATTILALNKALDELAGLSERRARVVELRFFAGIQESQIAELLGVSRTTISTDWRFARAWLLKRMAEMDGV